MPSHLIERLEKIRLATVAEKPNPYQYQILAVELKKKAEKNGRDFIQDLFEMIIIFYSTGYGDIDQAIENCYQLQNKKANLLHLKYIYGIQSREFVEGAPALSQISEAFPHASLVLSDMLLDATGSLDHLWFVISDDDLGVCVNRVFKMNYFAGLIDVGGPGLKAQVGLLLHNMCWTKALLKVGKMKSRVSTFKWSCSTSSYIMDQNLAPPTSRENFTAFVKSISLSPDLLCQVWNRVIGDQIVPICEETTITPLHRRVLELQPLNLQKWTQVMGNQV